MQTIKRLKLIPLFALSLSVCGCIDTQDLAPASPDTPWQINTPTTAPSRTAPSVRGSGAVPGHYDLPRESALPWPDDRPAINPAHQYSLVELIDIAQRSNKQTRIAWEEARQAAIEVGVSRAAYLPTITIDALGGYQRSVTPFPTNSLSTNLLPANLQGSLPTNLNRKGYIISNIKGIFPSVTMSYLLLDFGGRAASVKAAKQASYAANVSFTAAHQQVILDVSRAYFELGAADAQVESAAQSLRNAQLLLDAAEQKRHHGEGTVTDVNTARLSVAQARYAAAQAASARSAALYSLLAAMGSPPDVKLRVAFPSRQPLPRRIGVTLQELMQTALKRRPDLLSDLAKLRASQAEISAARSALLPSLLLSVKGSGKYGQISTDSLPPTPIAGTEAGVYLDFSWNIYQGGLLQNRVALAQSTAAEAADTLRQAQEQAMQQVALNYDELMTGITQYDSAVALQTASQTAFNSAADAYRHGVGTLTDATSAQTSLGTAKSTVAAVHSQVLTTAAALAFATGQLTSTQDANDLASRLSQTPTIPQP